MRVVLIGDSIRVGYQPLVINKCTAADVWGPDDNCGSGPRVLEYFERWIASQEPDLVHFNFGIHDCGINEDGEHNVPLPQYRLSLERVIAGIRKLEKAQMIWATTTPLYTADEDKPMSEWQIREESEIQAYNDAALEIVKAEGLPVNDLHEVVVTNDYTKCIRKDGCHMTDFGNGVLSDAVVKAINALT